MLRELYVASALEDVVGVDNISGVLSESVGDVGPCDKSGGVKGCERGSCWDTVGE